MTSTSNVDANKGYTSLTGAGQYLGMDRTTVRKLIASGDIPARRIGASIRIRLADLENIGEPMGPNRRSR